MPKAPQVAGEWLRRQHASWRSAVVRRLSSPRPSINVDRRDGVLADRAVAGGAEEAAFLRGGRSRLGADSGERPKLGARSLCAFNASSSAAQ
jgi:hypothetical protein